MLTIDNIEKIKQYTYDVVWSCDSINETDNFYHFVMERRNIGGKIDDVKKITICRNADSVYSVGKSYTDPTTKIYRMYLDDKNTKYVLTSDYIKDMINVVNTFTQILAEK